MPQEPKISIITPSFNQAKFLRRTIESVLMQDYPNIEYILIDGGSTDGSQEIIEAYADRLAHWESIPDKGQTDAINKGLRKARGRILAYLCADDFYEPDAFQRASRAFDAHPTADFVYGDGYFLEGDSGWKRRKNAGPFTWKRLLRGNFLIQPAVFIRAESMRRFGEFDATLRFCMDHEYWLRAGAHAQWIYVNEPLATSRLHAGAKTSRALAEAWWEAAHMQARHGIFWRPHLQALWMGVAGHHLYRLRRMAYRKLGQHTAARSRA